MKIGYLGAGTWGFALATLLAGNGHRVTVWTRDASFANLLERTRQHPKLPGSFAKEGIRFTSNLKEALEGAECLVESVTSKGLRPVLKQVLEVSPLKVPIILTSKGIEQDTGLLLPEVICELIGVEESPLVGYLSGPSHSEEVVGLLPCSLVSSAYQMELVSLILELFTTPRFRVYPNADLRGVAFGGAMKNIIAIACGISDGLQNGDNAKAALLTRGLHEIRKLSDAKGCLAETLNGLSGLGDLVATCMSPHSRNYRFGQLIAQGNNLDEALLKVGMAVEGIYTCVSAHQLAKKHQIPLPITESIYSILYEGLKAEEAVSSLLQRSIKEEHL